MTKFREATHKDRLSILSLSKQFYATLDDYNEIAPLDDDSVLSLIDELTEYHIMLVAENQVGNVVGILGMYVIPWMFNHNVFTAQEVVWYVEPDARDTAIGRGLLSMAEDLATTRNAKTIHMLVMPSTPIEVDSFLMEHGYVGSDSMYVKHLSA